MIVAFQGEIGAYSEATVLEHFGADVQTKPCKNFEDVFAATEAGECDYGLIPIENSVAGSIHRNYDLLLENTLSIVGEHYLRVHHSLIALPGVEISDIRKVISHPQALAQCDHYLRSLANIEIEAAYDTAGSVKIVRELGDRTLAAIASARAAQVYDMAILKEGIEDNPANFTRFLVIAKEAVIKEGECKTSIVFSLDNQPGALFKALSVFALRDVDLSKIESRPLVGKPWEYCFYVDLIGSTSEQKVERALNHLAEYALTVRVLGSYPRHRMNW
ncbi:MAG: prephenate dehydratase [Chloroflexota bacterium]